MPQKPVQKRRRAVKRSRARPLPSKKPPFIYVATANPEVFLQCFLDAAGQYGDCRPVPRPPPDEDFVFRLQVPEDYEPPRGSSQK